MHPVVLDPRMCEKVYKKALFTLPYVVIRFALEAGCVILSHGRVSRSCLLMPRSCVLWNSTGISETVPVGTIVSTVPLMCVRCRPHSAVVVSALGRSVRPLG